jgi:hypothetical protein
MGQGLMTLLVSGPWSIRAAEPRSVPGSRYIVLNQTKRLDPTNCYMVYELKYTSGLSKRAFIRIEALFQSSLVD